MDKVVVRPGNPFDFEETELEELTTQLSSVEPDFEVQLEFRHERGYGVSPYEVVELVSTWGGAAAAVGMSARMLRAAARWAHARWLKDKDEHPNETPRPRTVRVIYAPDGSVIRQVAIDLPDGEPREDEPPRAARA